MAEEANASVEFAGEYRTGLLDLIRLLDDGLACFERSREVVFE